MASTPQDTAVLPDTDALTAVQILERVARVYASCRSYRDAGLVQTDIWSTDVAGGVSPDAARSEPTVRSTKPFRTAFRRPVRFRFEYGEPEGGTGSRCIVWQHGADVRTWWDVSPGELKPASLGLAVAGATGISGGSAHTIPRLLLPREVGGTSLTELPNPTRLPDASLDAASCFVVRGTRGGDVESEITAWIDKGTFLVRRLDKITTSDTIRGVTTTTYEPEIDVKIGDGELAFDPPVTK